MAKDDTLTIGKRLKMSQFSSPYHEAYLNLLYTANLFTITMQKSFREQDLSNPQFNVLRILRGQKGHPISSKEIQSRMIHTNSNVSRILDKLKEKGLIEEEPCPENRRRNNVFIKEAGLKKLEAADPIPEKVFELIASVITEEEAAILSRILDKVRTVDYEALI